MTRYAVPAPPVQLPHGHLSAAGAPQTASASADSNAVIVAGFEMPTG